MSKFKKSDGLVGLFWKERNVFPEGIESPFQGPYKPKISVEERKTGEKNDVLKRISHIKAKIVALENQSRDRAKPGCVIQSCLDIIEKESDIGEKRELLKTLFAIAMTEGINRADVVKILKLRSKDPVLLVLLDQLTEN